MSNNNNSQICNTKISKMEWDVLPLGGSIWLRGEPSMVMSRHITIVQNYEAFPRIFPLE